MAEPAARKRLLATSFREGAMLQGATLIEPHRNLAGGWQRFASGDAMAKAQPKFG